MRFNKLVHSAALITALGLEAMFASAGAATLVRIGAGDQSVGAAAPSAGISQATFTDARKLLEQELAKDDVKIEWKYFKGGNAVINDALAQKQLDFAFVGDLAAIIGQANGSNTKLLAGGRGGLYYLAVAPDSTISKLEDLKGKRVALQKGSNLEVVFKKALAKAGLKETDLRILNLEFNPGSAAVAAKEVDAIWTGGQILPLRDKGSVKIVTSTKDLGKDVLNQAAFVGSADFVAAHPDLTQRIVNVTVKTRQFIYQPENREAYLTETAQRSGADTTNQRNFLASISDVAFFSSPRIDAYTIAAYQAKVEGAKAAGIITASFDVKGWAEPKFVEEALKQPGLQNAWALYNAEGEPSKDVKTN
jgi:sulfonate transport system substrate-binding protein